MKAPQAKLLTSPIDPGLFLEMIAIFQDSTDRPVPRPERTVTGYYPTDIPLNRGVYAILEALRARKMDALFEPIVMRLLALGQLLKAPEFARFIRPGADSTEISTALLKASAVSRFKHSKTPSKTGPSFDLQDVLMHACRFDDKAGNHEGGAS
jgi:hypothetical protein